MSSGINTSGGYKKQQLKNHVSDILKSKSKIVCTTFLLFTGKFPLDLTITVHSFTSSG